MSRSTSLTTCTNQLSIDSDSDDGGKNNVPSSSDNTRPLDLSAKPTNLSGVCDSTTTNVPQSNPFLAFLHEDKWPKDSNVQKPRNPLQVDMAETRKAVNDLLCSFDSDNNTGTVPNSIGINDMSLQHVGQTPLHSGHRTHNVTYGSVSPVSSQISSYPQQSVINSSGVTFDTATTSNNSSFSNNTTAVTSVSNVSNHKFSDTSQQSFSQNTGTSSSSLPQISVNLPPDPFAATQIMLSSLQQMSSKLAPMPSVSNQQSLSTMSVSNPSVTNSVIDLQSNGQSASLNFDPSLSGQQVTSPQVTQAPQSTQSLSSNNAQAAVKRSLSTSDRQNYNPSMPRNNSYCRSLSTSGLGLNSTRDQTHNKFGWSGSRNSSSSSPPSYSILTYQSSDVQGQQHSADVYSLRSPSPSFSYNLPPKKQRRCYGNTSRNIVCTKCQTNISGKKKSNCPNGHSSCIPCLEDRVKLVLTGKAKVCILLSHGQGCTCNN